MIRVSDCTFFNWKNHDPYYSKINKVDSKCVPFLPCAA